MAGWLGYVIGTSFNEEAMELQAVTSPRLGKCTTMAMPSPHP